MVSYSVTFLNKQSNNLKSNKAKTLQNNDQNDHLLNEPHDTSNDDEQNNQRGQGNTNNLLRKQI